MPIRINLLAEEQAAEEMRRRDPIKRAIYAGAGLAGVMIFWIGITQMNVMAARRELADYEARLLKVDESSKQVRNNQTMSADFEAKLKALHRYATNRLLWGTMLDGLQFTIVDNIRLTDLRSDQGYGNGEIQKFFTTNLTVTYVPPAPWWKVWASDFQNPPLHTLVSNQLAGITNRAPFLTNALAYTIKVTPVLTNAEAQQIQAKVEFTNPIWNVEKARVEIRGRDYSTPHGAAIDEFARRVTTSPLFKDILVPVEGFKFTERPPQARTDPADPLNPDAFFVPFTIELTFKDRIFGE
jgi:hypothetical protein